MPTTKIMRKVRKLEQPVHCNNMCIKNCVQIAQTNCNFCTFYFKIVCSQQMKITQMTKHYAEVVCDIGDNGPARNPLS